MSSRFTFPPVNLGVNIEAQLVQRAEWCGWSLIRSADKNGLKWKLVRGDQTFVFTSLCEVDMKLAALLEQIGERVERETMARLVAERTVSREVDEAMKTVN